MIKRNFSGCRVYFSTRFEETFVATCSGGTSECQGLSGPHTLALCNKKLTVPILLKLFFLHVENNINYTADLTQISDFL